MSVDDTRGTSIDTTVSHSARIWNYWLGGKDNYAVDRAAGDEFVELMPNIRTSARETRAFLMRVVRYLAGECGVRQFLDVGTGLPTANNTHEVAQAVAPDARIVYVDNDPLVLTHARALLTSTPQGATRYLEADMNNPATVLDGAREVLDLDQPVAVLFFGVLGHVADTATARSLVQQLLAAVPSGSYLALSDGTPTEQATAAHDNYADSGAVPYMLRAPEDLKSFFDGLELVEPGFGPVPQWRPELGANADTPSIRPQDINPDAPWGGVGRKP
jgi:hypothetical protein